MSRKIQIRFELLRNGAYCAELRAIRRTPRIRCDARASRKMLLTARFAPVARDADWNPVEIDWLRDEIRPVLIIDGTDHPIGVYVPAKPVDETEGPVKSVSVSAYDRTQKVFDSNTSALLYWPAGTLWTDAVESLLTASGIDTVFTEPCDAAFPTAREDWAAATPFLTVVNQLLDEINYNGLWFDGSGAAILEPAALPESSAIEHILDTDDPETRVVAGKLSRTKDYYDAANVFIVVCQNPEKGAPMRAEAVNDNPQSPISTVRRGRRICSVTYVDNIEDQAALEAMARRLRDESLISGEVIEIETGLQAGWGVGDVVGLNYHGETCVCISQGFDMELCVGGRMMHRLKKVVYALDV